MKQRSSVLARALATIALVVGFLLLIVVIATSLGDGDENDRDGAPAVQMGKQGGAKGEPPKSYVVQNGDTLTSIAHKTGVPVSSIEELNPGVDPQILVSGEKLKLR
jgi:LysM repeat protein